MTAKIVIGIPTFRRPQGLTRLLASIARQQAPFVPHVLVADNEGKNGAGIRAVAAAQQGGFPFPLTTIAVPERGISQVRNALLRVAFTEMSADALAMIDDDEQVEPNWIAALVAMQQQGQFDVVGGTVLPEFESLPPAWSDGLDIYYRATKPPPGPADIIYGTTNVLLHKALFHHQPTTIQFDPAFSLSGGGDAEFFRRLHRRGTRFGFAPEAVSHECFQASRMTRKWAWQRSFRIGSSDARIIKLHATPRQWLESIAKLTVALVVSPALVVALAWSPPRQMWAILLLARQLGKLQGFLGKPLKTYENTHGK